MNRLLVAHSDESLLDIYQSFFWDQGYEVEVAANVSECLATLPEFEPDVLMFEQELSGGGSDLVIARMRASMPTFGCSVLLLTSRPNCEEDGFGTVPVAPVYACLQMPASLSTLLEAVRSAGRRPKLLNRFSLVPIAVS